MRIRMLVAVAATALAATTVAMAAPTADQTVPLSAASPEFNWDGATGQHLDPQYDVADCSKDADNFCEVFLLDIQSNTPVKLDASATQFSSGIADFDLRIYKMDDEGTGPGDQVESTEWAPGTPGWGGPNGQEEIFSAANVEPGKYWLVVHHYFNPNATYKGNVKVTGATGGGTPPGGGGGTPPPGGGGTTPPSGGGTTAALPFKAAGTLGSAKKANKKRSLSFKATATETISNLKVSLVNSKKKVLGTAKAASFAAGSRTLKMKVKKLKAGRYSLLAEGLVNGERRISTQAVRIKK